MAPACEDRRVSSMAGSEIEDPRAVGQGLDERPDFGPRFSSPGRERFGDPIVRRPDVRFRSNHSSVDARAPAYTLARSGPVGGAAGARPHPAPRALGGL